MNQLTKSKRSERKKISSVLACSPVNTSEVCQLTPILNFRRNQAARHGSCLHEPITDSNFTWTLLLSFCAIFLMGINFVHAQSSTRKDISLNSNWLSIADEKSDNTYDGNGSLFQTLTQVGNQNTNFQLVNNSRETYH